MHIHPNWKQGRGSAYDAALLSLPIRLPIPTPVLAAPTFRLDPDDLLYGLILRHTLEIGELNGRGKQICMAINRFHYGMWFNDEIRCPVQVRRYEI